MSKDDSKNTMSSEDEDNIKYEDISQIPALQKLISQSSGFSTGFVRIHPYNQVFPTQIKNYLAEVFNFEAFEDDIWVTSFPKSGTTWTQEMVWCIKNKVDIQRAKACKLDDRVPFLEHSAIVTYDIPNSFSKVRNMHRPRIIKTHFSYNMLPKDIHTKHARVVYVARNPRDVCVSFCNHFRIFRGYTGPFEDVADLFVNDICAFNTPFFHHVLGYWQKRFLPNVLFIMYEEMKENLALVIRRVADFLGERLSDEQVLKLEDHLSFDNMRNNNAVNKKALLEKLKKETNVAPTDSEGENIAFMKKGKVGNWRDHFSNELTEKFSVWEAKGLKDSTLKFVFD